MLKTAAHVKVEATDGFKVSIPIEKALNNFGDVLLAYEMNGEDIPRDHGYPIRLIVPGYVGVRNIKWVKSIEISDEEMDSEWQRGISYK
jgi:sulfite oxidase